MIGLYKNGYFMEMPEDTEITLEIENPSFRTDAIPVASSFPFTFPSTPNNRKALGFPEVISNVVDFRKINPGWTLYLDGLPWKTGVLRVFEVESRIKVAFQQLSFTTFGKQMLSELDYGPDIEFADFYAFLAHAKLASQGSSDTYDYCFPTIENFEIFQDFELKVNGTGDVIQHAYFNYYNGTDYSYSNQAYSLFGSDATLYGKFFEQSMLPMWYLPNLIKAVFANQGIHCTGSLMENPDFKRVIISNNNVVCKQDGTQLVPDQFFNLKNHVPDMTVSSFLNSVKNHFNAAFHFDGAGNVELVANKDVLASPKTVSWDAKVNPAMPISFEMPEGYTISFPNPDGYQNIEDREKKVGDGDTDISSDITFADTTVIRDPLDGFNQEYENGISWWSEKCNVHIASIKENKGIPRFTFFVGFQPTTDTGSNPPIEIPISNCDGRSDAALPLYVTDFSLRMGGNRGLYTYWFKNWIERFLLSTKLVKTTAKLSAKDILAFDFKTKVQIKENHFLVKKIQIKAGRSLPAISAELLRV